MSGKSRLSCPPTQMLNTGNGCLLKIIYYNYVLSSYIIIGTLF